MTLGELHYNCRGVDMPVVKVKVPSDDGAGTVWAFSKVKGSRVGLECSAGEGRAYDRYRADPPLKHLKEIMEEGDWKGALERRGLEEGEVIKLFVAESKPAPEEEEVEEVEDDGED